ncbi:IS3 family transposase, partial [uncultured Tateyamaria sp.]|uniref:IS3 family transposase n=1 Tax=uncultured Tateyamaria sp. TaxID=455651 RepID=UPI0026241994
SPQIKEASESQIRRYAVSVGAAHRLQRVRRKTYRTRKQARADVFDYIECFYNPKRRHSTIGYLSPITFEERTTKA